MRGPRREVSRRELLLVAAAAVLLAVFMHWPLPLHLGDTIPKDLGDPLPQSWQVAWGGHALATQPLDFFQSNQFWPEPDSLAFGDALIGYAPAGLIGDGPHAAVVRYDLLFLFSYALAFFGAYLLAREMGVGPAGSAVAGAAFAYAPFRLEQDGHMQVISSGGIPLALALGVRAIRLRRPWLLVAAWAVAAWQVSIGFAIGLPFAYLLAVLVAIGAIVWWRRGRPTIDRRMLIAGVAGVLLFTVVVGMIARPYFRVADAHPEAKRPPSTVQAYSGPLANFITVSGENFVWGGATSSLYDDLHNKAEKSLFPGLVIVLLAAVGLGSSTFPRWLRWSLGGGILFFSALALGFQIEDGYLWPYRLVYELPGWNAIRTPGRLVTFSSLGLALLAAAGAEAAIRAWRRRAESVRDGAGEPGTSRSAAWAPAVIAGVLVLAIVIDGRGLPFDPTDAQDQPEVPYPTAPVADLPQPQLNLPARMAEDNRRYLLWSTDGFPEMVNGRASTNPREIQDLIADMASFPDRRTVRRLRDFGVRSVILHTDRTAGTPQAAASVMPVAGLPLVRSERPGLVIYELEPAPSAQRDRGQGG